MSEGAGDRRDRFRGALVGVAVGDALGAPFEGAPAGPVDALGFGERPGPWRYTDDTAMTIVLAESLLERGGADGEHLAHAFRRAYEAEPWRGYGAGPPRIFRRLAEGASWDAPAREMFGGEGSFGNGAAMRAAPSALFAHPQVGDAVEVAREQGLVTHAHRLGLDGAGVQAAAVATALVWDGPLDAAAFLGAVTEHAREPETRAGLETVAALLPDTEPAVVAAAVGNGIEARESVPAAVACVVLRPDSFADALHLAVALGGDTDTIAAMAGAIAGALHGESAIPEDWRERTEGADELRALADRLHDAASLT